MACDCEQVVVAAREVILARRGVCRRCEMVTLSMDERFAGAGGLTSWSVCRVCGCQIAALTKSAAGRCPLPEPKWSEAV